MFDPISQEDYYQFAAFFRNVEPFGIPISVTHMKANDDGIFTPLTSSQEFLIWQAKQKELSWQAGRIKDKLKALRQALLVSATKAGHPGGARRRPDGGRKS